jgi:hypothetical protein
MMCSSVRCMALRIVLGAAWATVRALPLAPAPSRVIGVHIGTAVEAAGAHY